MYGANVVLCLKSLFLGRNSSRPRNELGIPLQKLLAACLAHSAVSLVLGVRV